MTKIEKKTRMTPTWGRRLPSEGSDHPTPIKIIQYHHSILHSSIPDKMSERMGIKNDKTMISTKKRKHTTPTWERRLPSDIRHHFSMNIQRKSTQQLHVHPLFQYGCNECTYTRNVEILMRAAVDVDGMRPCGRTNFFLHGEIPFQRQNGDRLWREHG